MCGADMKNPNHFLLHCSAYTKERIKHPNWQRPYPENEGHFIEKLLFEKVNIKEGKEIIYNFWKIRQHKVKNLNS